jgi:hypothetical protein
VGEIAGMVISADFPLTLALSLRERGLFRCYLGVFSSGKYWESLSN